jgi:hypothetical protein
MVWPEDVQRGRGERLDEDHGHQGAERGAEGEGEGGRAASLHWVSLWEQILRDLKDDPDLLLLTNFNSVGIIDQFQGCLITVNLRIEYLETVQATNKAVYS